ncbi:MAG: hypothetical protein QM820_61365 [Minicystis sp.]
MHRGVLTMVLGGLLAGAAALGGGCGNTTVEFGSGGGTGAHGGNGHGGSTTSGGIGGDTPSSSSGDPSTTSSSGDPSTTSSSGGATTSSSSSGGGGCTVDPQDNACVKCSKESCCDTLVPCQNDQACVCWTGCLSQNPNNPGACAGCGAYDATTQAFVNCAGQKCGPQCGGGSSSSSSSASSSSGGGLCAPAAGDSACTTCAKMKCCDKVNACAGSANCVCWVSCLGQGGSTTACFGACGIPDSTTNALSSCSISQCPGTCP